MERLRPLLLTFMFLPLLLNAQTWCPPGATWYVNTMGLATEGYAKHEYVGDTMIGGMTAQRIEQTGYFINHFIVPPDTVMTISSRFTATNNDVVLLWLDSPNQQYWDTLYWFSANLGDRWFPAGTDNECTDPPIPMFEVADTSTILIDGFPLRQLEITTDGPSGTFLLTERIGSERMLYDQFPLCYIVEYGETLRCYSDQDIDHQPSWSFDCDSGVGISEQAGASYSVFPTLIDEVLYVHLDRAKPSVLTINDACGRIVLEEKVSRSSNTVDVSSLPPGMFVYRLMHEQGTLVGTGKVIKE